MLAKSASCVILSASSGCSPLFQSANISRAAGSLRGCLSTESNSEGSLLCPSSILRDTLGAVHELGKRRASQVQAPFNGGMPYCGRVMGASGWANACFVVSRTMTFSHTRQRKPYPRPEG